jgi:hypothetical protein
MPVLTDPDVIKAISLAFEWGQQFTGYVTWKRQAADNARHHFPDHSPTLIEQMAFDYLQGGGEIKYATETRDEWLEFGRHYDLVIPERPYAIYVETVLIKCSIDDPVVQIVNCHPNHC